jgi:hypothetical protein
MRSIVHDLVERFGERNISEISESEEKFDISRIGKDFFKGDEKIQFYIFEKNMGIELIAFSKRIEQNLARVIALNYVIEDCHHSKLPTHLICVTKEGNEFNCVIYSLEGDQLYQIREEYRNIKKS